MTTYWYTSDPHRGHSNIIKYCSRVQFMIPKDLAEYHRLINKGGYDFMRRNMKVSPESLNIMNAELDKRHNERVKPDDIVYDLGDFCFRNSSGGKDGEGELSKAMEYERKLNGKIIHIKGNHDKNNSTKTNIEGMLIKAGGKRIYMIHNPKHVNFNYEINLVGHIHEKWKFARFNMYDKDKEGFYIHKHSKSIKGITTDAINVGVDVWNFMPVTINEIMAEYHKWRNTLKEEK